ncbi:hypothetical protein [Streptococcus ovis]|uniref:hypothetical protein n=1 Tax=Streptococcus ovis TaxID=82806 RepID=UPI00036069EF|nr:hypothetical protein [Streptococcus ovis]
MAESKTETVFVIKNQLGEFLEFNSFTGLRNWTTEYSERCGFATQNAATLYCRNLIADAKVHGMNMEFDVFKHSNTITEMDVTIPDNQLEAYGLPKVTGEA